MSVQAGVKYREYTDEDRARGIAAMEATGGRSKLASVATGVPSSTLEQWVKSARVRSVQTRTPEIRAKVETQMEQGFQNTVVRYLKHLKDMPLEKTGAKDAAIVAGIAHTHLRLLRSQPTTITASTDLASFLSSAYGKRTVDVVGRALPADGESTAEEARGAGEARPRGKSAE